MTEPASIRYKNPGAMWGGNAISKKWGEQGNVALNDGTGQGNHIAVFPTYVAGICAQIDLWRTPRYKNKTFAEAIRIWSGGNSVESYINFVTSRVPGMTRNTVMDDAFWRGPMCIPFLKAQAWHEAGKQYPAPDADWIEAQRRVISQAMPPAANIQAPAPRPAPTVPPQTPSGANRPAPNAVKPKHAGIAALVLAIVAAAMAFVKAHPLALLAAAALIALAIFFFIKHRKDQQP